MVKTNGRNLSDQEFKLLWLEHRILRDRARRADQAKRAEERVKRAVEQRNRYSR